MNETDTPTFGMTDLEEQLKGPDGPARCRALLERFAALGAALDGDIRAGLAPADYERAVTVRNGVAAAHQLMVYISRSSKILASELPPSET